MPALPQGLPAVRSAHPLGGGDSAEVWEAQLADGRRVVVKSGLDPGFEAEGLQALAAAGAPVPAILGRSDTVLVLEYVSGSTAWESLGRALATVHQVSAAAFGWSRDNLIGPLPQANGWLSDWPEFFLQRRLAPWLHLLPEELARRLRQAMAQHLPTLLDHDVVPSLVHGDLWHGNVVAGHLIDPAVHYADRELDLAMLDLFGAIPAAMQAGYDAVWPLDPGWEQRRPALQLYHLLVHVALFGGSYHQAVAARLAAIAA